MAREHDTAANAEQEAYIDSTMDPRLYKMAHRYPKKPTKIINPFDALKETVSHERAFEIVAGLKSAQQAFVRDYTMLRLNAIDSLAAVAHHYPDKAVWHTLIDTRLGPTMEQVDLIGERTCKRRWAVMENVPTSAYSFAEGVIYQIMDVSDYCDLPYSFPIEEFLKKAVPDFMRGDFMALHTARKEVSEFAMQEIKAIEDFQGVRNVEVEEVVVVERSRL
ncbi:MAG: hypothetical protein Q9209_003823 [Squamulea sp. 1 TL-2023]